MPIIALLVILAMFAWVWSCILENNKKKEETKDLNLKTFKEITKKDKEFKKVIEKSEGVTTNNLDLSSKKEEGVYQITDHIRHIVDKDEEKVKHLNKKTRKPRKKIIKE
jgi:hypothetical protein